MNENKKVWVIVYRMKDARVQLLALKPNPEPGLMYEYYVVTGGIEEGEGATAAAFREVQEEIGVRPSGVTSLNRTITYVDKFSGKTFIEECFAAKINQETLKLNKEHIDYEWLSLDEFKKTIWWSDSREKLNDILRSFSEMTKGRSL